MTPFKAKWRQQAVISWAGLRGATSIVFAVMATVSSAYTKNDLFHIVFCVVLLSIGIQGSLLPWISRRLDMLDDRADVMRTFSDYNAETEAQFIRLSVQKNHAWVGKALRELQMPPNMAVALIERENRQIVPDGKTVIEEKDILILGAVEAEGQTAVPLCETAVGLKHPWRGKTLAEAAPDSGVFVVMAKRHGRLLIPNGSLRIRAGDTLVTVKRDRIACKEEEENGSGGGMERID